MNTTRQLRDVLRDAMDFTTTHLDARVVHENEDPTLAQWPIESVVHLENQVVELCCKLQDEQAHLRSSVDFSTCKTTDLEKKLSDLRETSRKLCITLAFGNNPFRGPCRQLPCADRSMLVQTMQDYLDPALKDIIPVTDILRFVTQISAADTQNAIQGSPITNLCARHNCKGAIYHRCDSCRGRVVVPSSRDHDILAVTTTRVPPMDQPTARYAINIDQCWHLECMDNASDRVYM